MRKIYFFRFLFTFLLIFGTFTMPFVLALNRRVVITFWNASLAQKATFVEPLANTGIIKQYGRRLVLGLYFMVNLEDNEDVYALLVDHYGKNESIECVEADLLVSTTDFFSDFSEQFDLNVEKNETNPSNVDNESFIVSTAVFSSNVSEQLDLNLNINETNETNASVLKDGYVVVAMDDFFSGAVEEYELNVESNETYDDIVEWQFAMNEPFGMRVEKLWSLTNGSLTTRIAVLDTGIHSIAVKEQWFENLEQGYDFVSDTFYSLDGDGRDLDSSDPGDAGPECPVSSWHGTRMAFGMAGKHNVIPGLHSVAWNTTILPLRVLGMCSTGFANDVTDAIVWAAGGLINGLGYNPEPAHIISMSFSGYGKCPSYLQSAISMAINQFGVIILAAAGNSASDVSEFFPANCAGVVVVGASTVKGVLAEYSNFGSQVAFLTPGGTALNGIRTFQMENFNEHRNISLTTAYGTSFSVAFASGFLSLEMIIVNQFSGDFRCVLQNSVIFFGTSVNTNRLCIVKKYCGTGILSVNNDSREELFDLTTFSLNNSIFVSNFNSSTFEFPLHFEWTDEILKLSAQLNLNCLSGYYDTGLNCKNCPLNTFSFVNSTSLKNCTAKAGYYGLPGTTAAACPGGTYMTGRGSTSLSFCLGCASGKYSSAVGQQMCRNCSAGTYSTYGSAYCLSCPSKTFSAAQSTSIASCVVNAGFYGSPQFPIWPCTADTYCPAGSSWYMYCPLNTQSPVQSTSILNCTSKAGFYGSPGVEAFSCAANFYCPAKSLSPIPCPNNTETYFYQSTAISNCTPKAGFYGIRGVAAVPCAANYYCPAKSSSQTPCPTNTESPAQSTTIMDCTHKAGFYGYAGSAAMQCTANTYCPTGSSWYIPCPPNTHSSFQSTASTDCKANAGFYGNAGIQCPENFYCYSNTNAPIQCPLNTQSPVQSTMIINCIAKPGFYGGPGTAAVQCSMNNYCQVGSLTPMPCPTNTESFVQSATILDCIPKAGFYRSAGLAAVSCAANYYCPANSIAQFPCPSNSSSPSQSTAITNCVSNSGYFGVPGGNMTKCPENAYSAVGSTSQYQCVAKTGFYGIPGSFMTKCANNSNSPLNSTLQNQCIANAGYYGVGGTIMTRCPSNSNSAIGSTSINYCMAEAGYLKPPKLIVQMKVDMKILKVLKEVCNNISYYVQNLCNDVHFYNPGQTYNCSVASINGINCPNGVCPCANISLAGRRLLQTSSNDTNVSSLVVPKNSTPSSLPPVIQSTNPEIQNISTQYTLIASNDTLVLCPANSYCPVGSTVQYPCPANSFSFPGSQSIVQCMSAGGYYGNAGTNMTKCPANTNSPPGSSLIVR